MCDFNQLPDLSRILVEVDDGISLSLPGYMNGVVHHVHDIRMDLRCVYENIGDTLFVESLDALGDFFP